MLTHVMKPTYVDEEPMFEEDPTFEELVEEPADMFEHEYVTQPSRCQNYVPVPDEGPRFVYQESARPGMLCKLAGIEDDSIGRHTRIR